MRELLSTNRQRSWDHSQERAFKMMKKELSKPTVLALYDPKADIKVSADASLYGLRAVLLQRSGDMWKPVTFASRAPSETEGRYAQIEKEALAVTWACEQFSKYLLGRPFSVETDHMPLVPLLSSKHLGNLLPRTLHFCLRLAWYDFTIYHVPRKQLYTADALSQAPYGSKDSSSKELEDVEAYVATVISNLPAIPQKLNEY